MPRDFLIARLYLAPQPQAFWEWRDGGKVLTWRDGTTIAFLPEVEHILERLAPVGLPPMDSVALFLAACRSGWRTAEIELNARRTASEVDFFREFDNLQELFAALDRLAGLPGELKGSLDRKAELAQTVFETGRLLLSTKTSAAIVAELRLGLPAEVFTERTSGIFMRPHARVAVLIAGLSRLDPARFKLRQKSGLEQLPAAAPVESQPDESFTGFLRRLEQDKELGSMARLARNLMAALTLPRSMAEQQELPLGGVSDITNRGPFDRLLVSELAHDDLTFTVRVALNEALYLRRETPPHEPPRQRVMLLDAGLRLWGVPRVFATAAALALSVTRRDHDTVAVYRAHGAHLDHVDLTTRDGLIAHLAALEEAVHPGDSLPTFRRLVSELDDAGEVLLITGEDVLADPQFRRALDAQELPLVYVVTVNRAGRLRLLRRTGQGTTLLREAHCELEQVLPPQPKVAPIIDPTVDPSLPAILCLSQFPLLLSHHFDPKRVWGDVDLAGVLCLTNDRRLMHWTDRRRAARQISERIPKGPLHWHDGATVPGGRSTAVIGQMSNDSLHLVHVDLKAGRCTLHPLALVKHHPTAVAAHAGALFVIFRSHVELFSQTDGRFIQTFKLPTGMYWDGRRFFRNMEAAYALSFNGTEAVLELVCKRQQYQDLDLIGLFERTGIDGPVGLTSYGEMRLLYQPAKAIAADIRLTNQQLQFTVTTNMPRFSRIAAASPDGRRMILTGYDAQQRPIHRRIDSKKGEGTLHFGDPLEALGRMSLAGLRNVTLHSRFAAIACGGNFLTLIGRKAHRLYTFTFSADGQTMLLAPERSPVPTKDVQFVPSIAPPGVGYKLSVAQWPDGSRAYLDSRGLLHLKSSDASIPETTLVLCDHAVSGWCADGRWWGTEYFIGDAPRTDPKAIYHEVLVRFAARLG
jgi:hypothetical protein